MKSHRPQGVHVLVELSFYLKLMNEQYTMKIKMINLTDKSNVTNVRNVHVKNTRMYILNLGLLRTELHLNLFKLIIKWYHVSLFV